MMADLIPVAYPKAQYIAHELEIKEAIERVCAGGRYILGPEVEAFEAEFAAYCGVSCCVGLASGTDALLIALKSCGVSSGDEVITVSQTAVATVAAIELAGAVPVFCDIDPVSRCIDPSLVEPLITSRTRAIVPVHLYGQPADMQSLCEIACNRGLKLIEDCAQAHGAMIGERRVGSFGDAASFSFYPTKNLGAIGDGGVLVTNNDAVAERARHLRQYGWKERYVSHLSGMNSRLDELQAAILRVKLPHLDADNKKRRIIAERYDAVLDPERFAGPKGVSGTTHAMHLYVVECQVEREQIMAAAAAAGIGTGLHYPQPVHSQPAYSGYLKKNQRLPVTDQLVPRILTLPLFPELSDADVEQVCNFLRSGNVA